MPGFRPGAARRPTCLFGAGQTLYARKRPFPPGPHDDANPGVQRASPEGHGALHADVARRRECTHGIGQESMRGNVG